jgi:NAD(P)H-hydrate epimerase
VVIADIGIQLDPEAGVAGRLIGPAWVARTLAALPAGAHKGQRGHVAIVGGGAGTPGAAVLAATGAMRAGAGLATIVTGDPDVRAQLLAGRPELMVAPWAGMDDPLPAAQALVVGPGLTDRAAAAGLPALWAGDPRPALWDASALDHVPIAPVDQPRIITPHPGEAARMLARTPLAAGAARSDAWTAARVQSDRVAAARTLAAATGAITLLKGEGTVIATPAGEIRVCVTGGPALATAGSGDVLAGIGGAMLGRGLEPVAAAAVAVHAHGIAGDLAGARRPHPLALEIADSVGAAARACARRDVSSAPRWPRRRLG